MKRLLPRKRPLRWASSNLTGVVLRRHEGTEPDLRLVHKGPLREDAAWRWPSASQGQRLQEKPSLLAP